MTRQEIEKARLHASLSLLARSGVGYIFAVNALGDKHTKLAYDLALAGSEPEAFIKMALQYAFGNHDGFKAWLENIAKLKPHTRFFRVVR